jgi:hypothetical protein
MNKTLKLGDTFSWIFALFGYSHWPIEFAVGASRSRPYIPLSFTGLLPPANNLLRGRLGFSVPILLKIILGILIIMFTLGVSDLGDMMDWL